MASKGLVWRCLNFINNPFFPCFSQSTAWLSMFLILRSSTELRKECFSGSGSSEISSVFNFSNGYSDVFPLPAVSRRRKGADLFSWNTMRPFLLPSSVCMHCKYELFWFPYLFSWTFSKQPERKGAQKLLGGEHSGHNATSAHASRCFFFQKYPKNTVSSSRFVCHLWIHGVESRIPSRLFFTRTRGRAFLKTGPTIALSGQIFLFLILLVILCVRNTLISFFQSG